MDEDKFSRTQPIPLPGRIILPRRPLYVLAGAILVAGLATTWWWTKNNRPPPLHPETAAFEAVQEPRIDLLDGLRSYEAEAAVRLPLEAAGLQIERRVLRRPPSERYPPRVLVSLSVENYRHLSVDGQLTLEFFNDRLMEADFRPNDPDRYARQLRAAMPQLKRDRVGHAEWSDGTLRVWSNVELARSRVGGSLRTDALVIWQDLRLIAQRDDWDARFGAIPVPAAR